MKWTGSKEWLIPAFHSVEECFEPFAGSAKISLAKASVAHLNDTCIPLMATYESIASTGSLVVHAARGRFTSVQEANDPAEEYYELRNEFNRGQMRNPEQFLALLYLGFNGLWRVGPNGMNVPYGGRGRRFPYESLMLDFELAKPKLAAGRLTCKDFRDCYPPNDSCLMVIDPPYSGTFTGYSGKGWSDKNDDELASYMFDVPNPVVLCNVQNAQSNWATRLRHIGFNVAYIPRTYTNGRATSSVIEIVGYDNRCESLLNIAALGV